MTTGKSKQIDFNYEKDIFTILNEVEINVDEIRYELQMFEPSNIASVFTKNSMVPESWRTFLEFDDETETIEYGKFVRLEDTYAFTNPDFQGEGLGKIKVI